MSRLEQIAIAAAVLGVVFALGYAKGGGDARAANAEALAEANVALATAQTAIANSAAAAAGAQAQFELRLRTESDDAAREIAAFSRRPPAPGSVGPDALVDPGLGRAVLCRIGRLRDHTAAECGPAP